MTKTTKTIMENLGAQTSGRSSSNSSKVAKKTSLTPKAVHNEMAKMSVSIRLTMLRPFSRHSSFSRASDIKRLKQEVGRSSPSPSHSSTRFLLRQTPTTARRSSAQVKRHRRQVTMMMMMEVLETTATKESTHATASTTQSA